MSDSIEDIQKKKRLYMMIGALLFVFTGVTVAMATVPGLDFGEHGFDRVDATVGLLIASFKASLVMLIFMHLNHEKKLIYLFYGMALVMAFFCMALIGWSKRDPIRYGDPVKGNGFYNPEKAATKPSY
jgi:caa(3)-type oxidase subunit IV